MLISVKSIVSQMLLQDAVEQDSSIVPWHMTSTKKPSMLAMYTIASSTIVFDHSTIVGI